MNPAWLQEWELYKALHELPADEHPAGPGRIPEIHCSVTASPAQQGMVAALWRSIDQPGGWSAAAVDSTVALTDSLPVRQTQVGDVLHLSPQLTDEDADPVFVLVTEVRDGAALLTAFSSLGLPAAGDELLTGIDEEGLRVLSTWNAYWVPLSLTGRSWPVPIETRGLMADFAAYRQSVHAGHGVPARMSKRIGPPLQHPDDPRWAYYVNEGNKLIRMVELGLQLSM